MAEPATGRGRGVDLIALLAGIATLMVSSYLLSDGPSWWPDVDPRWLLAGGALIVGIVLLGSSLRRSS
ncbi:MAG: hypothetical protein ACRDQ7_11965 [Haloechinothrix sp.]